MSRTKDYFMEIQEQRRDEWIAANCPDAEEDSEEWYDAAQEYGWYQDWMEEAAEQQYFEASLASIPDRLENAKDELQELEQLLQIAQPGIVLRMAFVQVVTVMDSFLMYSARALLNHEPHLNRFMQQATLLVAHKGQIRMLLDPKWSEQEPNVDTPVDVYRWRAQALVGKMTFQNHKSIRRYFTTMLTTPYDWPLDDLEVVIRTRNDLVHRNGVTASHEPVHIWPDRVRDAIRRVTSLIEAAAVTLLQEDSRFRTDDVVF
ncbi:hypothetical protein B194_5362 [Serratia plymuthica A30]|uniref:hypothetical protein n=1 Tax=Serratia plymuthica TaxID=82996 RepID=UPI0002A3F6B6|nr:hypothetical protein [Serratia plymuthica]EKF67068.1 hypothetical protein B194_5362 [Serratia plymuthica A30]